MILFIRKLFDFTRRRIALWLYHRPKIVAAYYRRLTGHTNHVKDVFDGDLVHAGERFAIFLIWQPKGLSWSVRNALETLKNLSVNVVIVANHDLPDTVLSELKASSRLIVTRDNTGFDIGGFRDGTRIVAERYVVSRLIYLNDSIYIFKAGLRDLMVRLLTSKADVCTAFENWEFTYHIQSFCFSVSGDAFRSERFQKFWKDYLPVNSRLWAIHKGEIALTRALRKDNHSIEAVFNPILLEERLREESVEDLQGLNQYLPAPVRISEGAFEGDKTRSSDVAREFTKRIGFRSQVHTGGFLYKKYFNNPIMKRDLVYRLQYDFYDIIRVMEDVGAEGHELEILSEMRRKGTGTELRGWNRVKFDLGIA